MVLLFGIIENILSIFHHGMLCLVNTSFSLCKKLMNNRDNGSATPRN